MMNAGSTTEILPSWNLADLFPNPGGPEVERALADALRLARVFHETYAGKLPRLEANALADAIAAFQDIDEQLTRLFSHAHLIYAADSITTENGRYFQMIQEKTNEISVYLVFFTLELNRLDPQRLDRMILRSPVLARWQPWLRDVRLFQPHQLSDELERLLHDKNVVGRSAWTRLFDQTIAELRFPIQGKNLSATDALNLLSDADPLRRRQAGETIGQVLGSEIKTFALIFNTLMKDKEIEDRWRGYPTPASHRHLANRVEPDVVTALVQAVREAYPRLSHRYYRLKAQWFGQKHLDYWDRNAPLPQAGDQNIPWSEARQIVLKAFQTFSPKLSAIAEQFFNKNWIDAAIRPGKTPGAFSHPTVPSVHPYILLNYHGKTRDIMTLAHELGHGVHQVLAGRQGLLLAETPLTLAETASVFGEMLTFQALLTAEPDPRRRWALRAAKVEDMLNTVVRQIAFYQFEDRLHAERRTGEVPAERISDIWLETQQESLGPILRFDRDYRYYWAYIPHFIHSPFYVYAYAFGDCLVNSLYACFTNGHKGFVDKYFDLLSAGGSKRYKELLAPFGLNAGDPGFWSMGLNLISSQIDILERGE